MQAELPNCQRIAPDVNLYGCGIGDETKIAQNPAKFLKTIVSK